MIIAVIALMTSAGAPQDYLTSVVSPVYEVDGSPAEIASRGERCIAQNLAAGAVGGELIISRDIEGGTVIARNAVSYRDGLLTWQMRSRVTFTAREGRFRIEHSGIERFNDQSGGWSPVGKWFGSGWSKAEDALKAQNERLSNCVRTAASPADEW